MSEIILRTFIAVELDQALRDAIARVQSQLKRAVPPGSVRWVAPTGIHLTLKFLGDTPERRVPDVVRALQLACALAEPFEFTVEGRGCFPNFRRPRVVWVAVSDRGQWLAKLQAAVERHVAPLGWPTEERGFSPHLTLGRLARSADAAAQAAAGLAVEKSVVGQIGAQQVTALSLIRSDLRPEGAVYSLLARVPLAPAATA